VSWHTANELGIHRIHIYSTCLKTGKSHQPLADGYAPAGWLERTITRHPWVGQAINTVATGMLLGAGPPCVQLALSREQFVLHAAVIREAVVQRRDEIAVLSPNQIDWR
uniref:hypothetical protein n=1 Tax=Stomatohabitans albus TaxID=3110766 RepID=UPI00300D738C